MKNLTIIISLWGNLVYGQLDSLKLSANVSKQIQSAKLELVFDTCYVLSRANPYDTLSNQFLFYGGGVINFFNDSIVLTFSNSWECGKYMMHLSDTLDYTDAYKHVTLYSGKIEYYGWEFNMLLIEYHDGSIEVVLETEYYENVAMKRRIYVCTKKI